MRIPVEWDGGRMYVERLRDPVVVERSVFGRPIVFLLEPVTAGFVHACTLDDVVWILEQIPAQHLRSIKTFVLRQPTRKEAMLRPCWGRLVYWANLGRHAGPTIYLDAQEPSHVYRWALGLDPDDMLEL
jgi:hypothetical protein